MLEPAHGVLVTSAIPMMSGGTGNLYLSGRHALLAEHRLIDNPPNGTGDLFAALLVAARLGGAGTQDALSHAASAIFAVLERTAMRGTEEMRIVESAERLVNPQRKFECIALGP